MDFVKDFIQSIVDIVWGWPKLLPLMVVILLGSGIFITLRLRFIQLFKVKHAIDVIRGKYDNVQDAGDINHFQALAAALSATVGIGNIAGVATAIYYGGPGALFWMWITAVFGMALKYAEATLAVRFRKINPDGSASGGPMYYIEKGLGPKWKPLAIAFASFAVISSFGTGNSIQAFTCSDQILSEFKQALPTHSWLIQQVNFIGIEVEPVRIFTGIVLATLVALVILGGIRRIGKVAAKLAPFMALFYVVTALLILLMQADRIFPTFATIFAQAFNPRAELVGFAGGGFLIFLNTVVWGVKRGLFSNEAGQGSAPIAHSAAKTNEPAREGVVGGIGPFIDTILICTLTALVILSTGTWDRSPQGMMKGTVELSADGLVAPTDVSALPALDDWEKWQPGSQVFFLIEAPDEDDKDTMVRQKIMGRIKSTDSSAIIEWGEMPKGAIWTTDKEGAPEKRIFRDFKGATLTSHAFDVAFPGLGKWLVTLAAWLFAISTMISWSYYGEQGVLFLMGKKAIIPYKFIFCLGTIIAPIVVTTDSQLGELADFGTGWMLWANMPIVLALGYLAVRCNNDYFKRLKAGEFKKNTSKKA